MKKIFISISILVITGILGMLMYNVNGQLKM